MNNVYRNFGGMNRSEYKSGSRDQQLTIIEWRRHKQKHHERHMKRSTQDPINHRNKLNMAATLILWPATQEYQTLKAMRLCLQLHPHTRITPPTQAMVLRTHCQLPQRVILTVKVPRLLATINSPMQLLLII